MHKPSTQISAISLPIILILCTLISAFSPFSPVDFKARVQRLSQDNSSDFQLSKCMKSLPVGVVEGRDVVCGYLTVPEDHSNLNGSKIQLAVMIIKSEDLNPKPDPLVMAQGGPGGSTIDSYADTILTSKDFVKDRDIVLFDQRGTLYSKPDLYCKQIDQLTADTVEQDLSESESERLYLEALGKCHQQLTQDDGVNLSHFDSLQNAEDIESLRQSLGYGKINYYGVSYGTLLGLHYINLHPDSLRSAILDGVIVPQTNFVLKTAQTMNQAFERLFQACQIDPQCNRGYPDLMQVFYKLVDDLNQKPARIKMSDRDTGATYPDAVIDGTTFLEGIFQMLYSGKVIPGIPKLIYDARDGKWDVFGQLLSLFVFDHTMSLGMYYSVMCAEDADYAPGEADMAGLPPEVVKAEKDQPDNFLQECKLWNVEQLGSQVDQPVTSSVPTLLLSGYFDPIAPSEYADQAAKTLTHSYHFIFPNGGHGQALDDACPDQIIQNFINSPDQRPDSSCIDQLSPPKFLNSSNTIDFPAGMQILNYSAPMSTQLPVYAVGLLCLLSAVPAIPLIMIIAWLRRRKTKLASIPYEAQQTDQGIFQETIMSRETFTEKKGNLYSSRTAGWIAFISGPILLVFTMGLAYKLFQMAFANDLRIYFGLDSSATWLFILPLVFCILGSIMAYQAVSSWLRVVWSGWTRLYFSLLAIAAVTCIVLLAIWGVLTALL